MITTLDQFPVDRKSWAYNNLIGMTPKTTLWTPALTFATAGDLSVSYTKQLGRFIKIGNFIHVWYYLQTFSFTHTTASGVLTVTGLPIKVTNVTDYYPTGSTSWGGITKANYTQVLPFMVANDPNIYFDAAGSGQAHSNVVAADVPTGGTVFLLGELRYETD